MDSVLRALVMYAFLFLVFRLSGKRSLAQATTFDFVLLLIIGEATQQALLGEDFSLFNAFLVIVTLLGIDLLLSVAQRRFTRLRRYVEGLPVVLVDRGQVIPERMRLARVSEDDLLEKARVSQGLQRLDQIKYAVLEKDGSISIIPRAG